MSRVKADRVQTSGPKVPQSFTAASFTSGQFGDGDAAFDPHRVDVAQRRQSVREVKQLLAVHKHTEPTSLTVNLNLERLRSDEGEEGDGSVGVSPGPGHTGPAHDLSVPEPNAELQSHVGRGLPGRSTAACQGNVEPVRTRVHNTNYYNLLPRPHPTCNVTSERNCQKPLSVSVISVSRANARFIVVTLLWKNPFLPARRRHSLCFSHVESEGNKQQRKELHVQFVCLRRLLSTESTLT